jgi:hypothetical protein
MRLILIYLRYYAFLFNDLKYNKNSELEKSITECLHGIILHRIYEVKKISDLS